MITHENIRTALFATLQEDSTVKAAISAWYRLVVPDAPRHPFVAVTDIFQPTSGIPGTSDRRTRRSNPMNVTVVVGTEKHNVDSADEDLGDAYIAVYDCICATPSLGITGLKFVGINISTRPMTEYGKLYMGAEINISYIYNNI